MFFKATLSWIWNDIQYVAQDLFYMLIDPSTEQNN